MIQMPRRSVTRFFIPLIDVMTLLFCIFLLMPMIQSTGEGPEGPPLPALDLNLGNPATQENPPAEIRQEPKTAEANEGVASFREKRKPKWYPQ